VIRVAWLVAALVVAAIACRSKANDRACNAASACAPSEYCEFEPGLCGKTKRAGVCRPRPSACHYGSAASAPVCACDGNVYASECEAHAAGVDLAALGGCRNGPPSYAPCGATFCDARTSYCEIVLSDVLDPPTDYACKPLPPTCIADGGVEPTCDCFPKGTRCLSFCGPMDTHGGRPAFHLTCRL
jgi:hypothetical protein